MILRVNRLIEVITPTQNITYSYDANDNRVAKTTTAGTTTYLVDTNTPYAQVITESKSDGTTIDYTYGTDLLTQTTDAQSLFYLADALGSTKALTDQTESITDHYTYSPYGELLEHVGTNQNEFLFTGEQYDQTIDSYYLRARYYSAKNARFLTRDTYDGRDYEPDTLNHYGYVHGNPVNYIDPSGHYTIASVASSISLRATTLSSRLTVPFSQQGLKKLFVEGILDNGQSVVVDLVTNFVLSELAGFNPDLDPAYKRGGGKSHSAATAGTAAHTKLELAIKEYKPFGDYVTLKAEVYYENKKDKKGKKGNYKPSRRGGKNNTICIDIEVELEGELKVIMDLKTGKSGFSLDRARDHGRRSGGGNGSVPVVEIFLPFL